MPGWLCCPLGCVQLGLGLSLEGGQHFCWLTFAVTSGRTGVLTESFVSGGCSGGQAPGRDVALPAPCHCSLGMGFSGCP